MNKEQNYNVGNTATVLVAIAVIRDLLSKRKRKKSQTITELTKAQSKKTDSYECRKHLCYETSFENQKHFPPSFRNCKKVAWAVQASREYHSRAGELVPCLKIT